MNGMEDNEDETDLFEDDDFDDLSESALQELEQNALLSTQQAQVHSRSLPNANNVSAALRRPAPVSRAGLNIAPHQLHPSLQRHLHEQQSEDESFELIGDEGVATPVEHYDSFTSRPSGLDESAQRELFRQQRYGHALPNIHPPYPRPRPQQRLPGHSPPSDGRYHGVPARPDPMVLDEPSRPIDIPDGDEPVASRARIEELMTERDQLAMDLRTTKDAISMQKGEISIIRANAEKESKVFDRQMTSLKRSIEEEAAKHRAALEAMTEKNRQLTTRYQFLQQEHNQEVQELKALKQRLKDRAPTEHHSNITSTPKRGMAGSLRDGFDDDDVMLLSPSKSARRSKPSTPTTANKRKRKAGGASPVKALPLRLSGAQPSDMAPPQLPPHQIDGDPVLVVRKDPRTERDLRFLQHILDYHTKTTKQVLLESLAKFSLPSNPTRTFSSIVLEGIARVKGNRLASSLLQIFIELFSKSMNEQYYTPISLLVEVVDYIVDLEMSVLDNDSITGLVPLLQTSIALNAEKRFKHSPVNHSSFGKFRATPQSVLNHDVNGTVCLELLLTIAYCIIDENEVIDLFWRLMDPEFVLMMLNPWQPISDIILILRLLATSIFSTTFGSIASTSEEQEKIEHWFINRVCWLLWETPKVDEGLNPNTMYEICELRLQVMQLLTQIAITSSPYPHDDPSHHGSLLIAKDAHATARIVRSLYDEVAAMYLLTPTHEQHAEIVNSGVRVLHHILTMHSSSIDLQEKLSVINGGVHKHRVVLTRLAFSEGFYIDRFITDETVAMATRLLEESVTPDEADELIEAFPGFRGRGNEHSQRMEIEEG